MRNINVVIDKMLAQVPDTPAYAYLISDLERVASSASYSSPENMRMWWEELSNVVHDHMPKPTELRGWQVTFVDIFQDKA